MRLSILPILLAGASVATLVAAEPIRIIHETPSNANANIRFGLALANANVNGNDDNVRVVRPPQIITSTTPENNNKGISRHFCGGSLREKAIRISNALRHALGMPLIETHAAAVIGRPGEVHILPHPVQGAKVIFLENPDEENDHHRHGKDGHHGEHGGHHNHHPEHHGDHEHHGEHGKHGHHHHKHHGHHRHPKNFLRRIHRAIKALGPWEGRAVSFVLGCGIGVLLRMLWVLSVLTYRTVRGDREEEVVDREYIVYEQVPETLFVAPPQYADEKAVLAASEETERK